MSDIPNIIKTTLSIPVQTGLSVMLTPKCAVYECYQIETGLVGDGEETESVFNHQIDLFYKDVTQSAIHTAAKQLKTAITTNIQCTIPMVEYTYESVNHYWRATIRFQTTEE